MSCGALSREDLYLESEQKVNERQADAVRVRQRPHQPAGVIGKVQVEGQFEAVQGLEHQPKGRKHEERPPAELEVQARVMRNGEMGGRERRFHAARF